ncbi:hypothetical protein PBS_01990 [Paraburkholderia sp. 2C]
MQQIGTVRALADPCESLQSRGRKLRFVNGGGHYEARGGQQWDCEPYSLIYGHSLGNPQGDTKNPNERACAT